MCAFISSFLISCFYRAGGTVENMEGFKMLAAPPISILLDQQLTETYQSTSDGVNRKVTYIDQSLFAITCAVDRTSLTLFPLDISIKLDTISSLPQRKFCSLMKFMRSKLVGSNDEELMNGRSPRPSGKRQKLDCTHDTSAETTTDVMVEVTRLADLLSDTIDSELDYDEIEEKIL
jgi:hypothetical protein